MKQMRRSSLLILLALLSSPFLCAQDADGVYSKVDENPVPTKTAAPQYPDSLRRDGVVGLVAVACVIDEEGKVTNPNVTKSTDPAFNKPALEAIQKWKFKPGKKDGKPVKVRVTIPFRFDVES
ncbi:MAG: energy transducer TonB [Opitutae bacterium]|nr:energy transducer TonB [Opitutae bacterium]